MAQDVGHSLGVGEGDRVVAAEDDRDRPGPGHLLHRGLEGRERHLDVAGEHLDVPGVDHPQVGQAVGAQGQARTGAVVREVVGAADGHRPEPRARPVRGAPVEGRTHDHDVRAREARGVVEVAGGDAQEGEVGAVLLAVARHTPILGSP